MEIVSRSFSCLSDPPVLLVFSLHSEDKLDHAQLARRLVAWSSYPVAVPNYRLTSPSLPHKHPLHAQDLLRFLHYLLEPKGPDDVLRSFDSSRLYLLGHSCSAHMLTSIFFQPPLLAIPDSSLIPSSILLGSTKAIVLSEGIYDLDLLLQSYPGYKDWFVTEAFGDLPSYEAFNNIHGKVREGAEHIRWLVIHSSGDTLVHAAQSACAHTNLSKECKDPGKVEKDWSLTAEHNQILREEGYPEIVSRFILAAK